MSIDFPQEPNLVPHTNSERNLPVAGIVFDKYDSSTYPAATDSTTAVDAINPSHYKQGKFETIELIESVVDSMKGADPRCIGLTWQVLKYTCRWYHKNGREDLRKAQWYLDRLVDNVENSNKPQPTR